MFHKLLIALDASERAEGVFRCAVDLADSMGASIHLLRAVAVPPEFPPAGHVSEPDALPAYLAKQAEEQLLAFAEQVPHLHVETTVVESPQPWRAILDVAEKISADLIVVGSHGYHGIDYLLGTNAGRVANLARRNVLVVHSPPDKPPAETYRHGARALGVGRG
jgi:nucleotide-binding universal stress UspA family protein